jgi:hypothetical protein
MGILVPPPSNEIDARALTESLLKNVGDADRIYESRRLEIYAADVEAAVERFHALVAAHREFSLGFPCIVAPTPAPIDWIGVASLFYPKPYFRGFPFFPDYYRALYYTLPDLFRPMLNESNLGYMESSVEEAVSMFSDALIVFLTTRFSARQSNISTSPGLRFRVITQRQGLRVHWTPSYFFNPANVFGSPTSPIDGWIQPGTYKFGAVGPGFLLKFDPANFHIPPLNEAQLVGI